MVPVEGYVVGPGILPARTGVGGMYRFVGIVGTTAF